MIGRGRFAGLLAALLIPVMLIAAMLILPVMPIGRPAGGLLFGRAWFASPPLAAWTAPLLGLGAIPTAQVAMAKAVLFWPIALVAVAAAWLARFRHGRWRRLAVDHGEATVITADTWPDAAPSLAEPAAPAITAQVAERTPVEGADLAARARFVAMSFAFSDAGPSRANISRDDAGNWPLHMDCWPTRFTLTLQHAALGYRLEFCNRGAEQLGPLMIRADLVTAERSAHGGAEPLPLCHYLDSLPVGDSINVTGELRLPLAGVAAMRLGSAELLVPMMRICAESTGEVRAPLNVSARFAVGLPPLTPGGGIQPFRLDSGPGIWRKLTARRLVGADLP